MVNKFFIDRKYYLPRFWSNQELRKFAPLFGGEIVNVSGWQDLDKEGNTYQSYFVNANNYYITNYKSDARGFQGYPNEIFLDLEKELPIEVIDKFDVVFNHTVLEHIFDVNTAFKNLCLMSKDIVILVVPFLQQMHANYGDYWRFTPLSIKKMFEQKEMSILYLSFNSHQNASVYILTIATKHPAKWQDKINQEFSYLETQKPWDGFEAYIGCHAIGNNLYAIENMFWRNIFHSSKIVKQKFLRVGSKLKKMLNKFSSASSK